MSRQGGTPWYTLPYDLKGPCSRPLAIYAGIFSLANSIVSMVARRKSSPNRFLASASELPQILASFFFAACGSVKVMMKHSDLRFLERLLNNMAKTLPSLRANECKGGSCGG